VKIILNIPLATLIIFSIFLTLYDLTKFISNGDVDNQIANGMSQ